MQEEARAGRGTGAGSRGSQQSRRIMEHMPKPHISPVPPNASVQRERAHGGVVGSCRHALSLGDKSVLELASPTWSQRAVAQSPAQTLVCSKSFSAMPIRQSTMHHSSFPHVGPSVHNPSSIMFHPPLSFLPPPCPSLRFSVSMLLPSLGYLSTLLSSLQVRTDLTVNQDAGAA